MNAVLIGLPQSGKSTLFSAVTGTQLDPCAAPEPTRSVVRVPDQRLDYLTLLCKPKKVVEATIEVVDVPGFSLDDAHGQDLWRRVLPVVRKADVVVIVARDFQNAAVPAFRNRVDAKADFAAMWEELIFADLDTVTTRVERLQGALKRPSKSHDIEKRELALLTHCRAALESEAPVSTVIKTEEERRLLSSFAFLTDKPLIGVRNVDDDHAASSDEWNLPHVESVITLSASIEAEIALLDPADRSDFLAELGLQVAARDRFIQACYQACGLISFLTIGKDEVRAWTIERGTSAVGAAKKIHTDLARGFIRAETVAYDDLVSYKDMKGAKAAGRVRKEGKGYLVQDGDIIEILANV